MQGRLENKIKTEKHIQNMLNEAPECIKRYYYSISQKTHSTKLRYITNAIRFINYIGGDKNLNVVDQIIIEQYMESINYIDKGNEIKELSQAGKANIYSSLSSFFKFLKINRYIEINPFTDQLIERPKISENDVVFLTPEEVKSVEEYILNQNQKYKYRDLLLFRIPVINGLRVTALSEINIQDIDFVEHTIKVVEKGNISKKVYIDDTTINFLNIWIKERDQILNGRTCDALFITSSANRITVRTIERIIIKHTEKIVIGKHITPHKLRSTCGTNLYQAKKDIYLVANVLGHKSTTPTRRYTKVFDTDKQDAINTLSSIYS